jgi:uncharacterized cysteine cluster protein YcgN (CxxCxxCC family)
MAQTTLVRIARRKQRRRRKNLTAAQKSELCQACGKCCMAMTFEGGEVDAGRYSCAIYDTRPRMCRDYEGWAAGPTGVPDCLWFEPDDA